MTNTNTQNTSTGMHEHTDDRTNDNSNDNSEKSTTEEAKRQAQDLSNKAQQKAGEAKEQVQQTASDLAEGAKRKANEYASEAQDRARSAAEQRKENAASGLEGVASGLREAGRQFHDEDQEIFARYADSAASGVEDFSDYLRNHSTGELLGDVEGFARRQPEVFVAGALAAGFFLGRFFKSSSRRSHDQQQSRQYNSQDWRSDPAYAQRSGSSYYSNQPGNAQYGPYSEQRPETAMYGTDAERNRFYQERQYMNRPYDNVTAAERVDRSSAVGSTGTATRTWDSTDVDTVEGRGANSEQTSESVDENEHADNQKEEA